jgi:hypothetical protein
LTTVVLLVLAILWGVLLVSGLRSRSGNTFANSVGTFRHHLRVLERAAPPTVAPANRLRGGHMAPAYRSHVNVMPGQGVPVQGRPQMAVMGGRRVPVATYRRRQAQKRRRDVFFTLLVGAVGSFAVAMIPGVSVMWPVQGLFDVLLILYVALLIHMRNAAAERELRATFGPGPRPRPARPRPGYDMGGSYGQLGLQPATYDFGGSYGELGLRRAAN